jgi:exonuclease III
MKLVSLNVEKDLHNDVVLEFLKREEPDVICLQEFLEENLNLYKNELGLDAIYQTCRYETSKNYPNHIGKKQGVIILAKNITESGYIFYVGKEESTIKPFDPENFETSETLVWADIKSEGGEIFKIVNIHLPVTQHGATTPKQLEDLKSAFQKLDTLGDFVLCGDMNAPRIYETFKKISEKYRDNIPLEYKTSLDRNLHRIGKDKFVTEGMDKYVVDGLFTTPLYETSNVRLMDSLSDHMAVVGEISKK